jgi:hypothetical protein
MGQDGHDRGEGGASAFADMVLMKIRALFSAEEVAAWNQGKRHMVANRRHRWPLSHIPAKAALERAGRADIMIVAVSFRRRCSDPEGHGAAAVFLLELFDAALPARTIEQGLGLRSQCIIENPTGD